MSPALVCGTAWAVARFDKPCCLNGRVCRLGNQPLSYSLQGLVNGSHNRCREFQQVLVKRCVGANQQN